MDSASQSHAGRATSVLDERVVGPRVRALHEAVLSTPPALCAERALLVTRYARTFGNLGRAAVLERADALRYLLTHKRAIIYPQELLVGCFTAHRVGGGLFPELHGVAMLEDLLRFDRRTTNPLRVDASTRWALLTDVLPFWLPRFLAMRIRPLRRALRFIADQLDPDFYLINETGGISHFVPDYGRLLDLGTRGLADLARDRLADPDVDPRGQAFLEAVCIVCAGLEGLARGFVAEAQRLAEVETDPVRRGELLEIAEVCARVPAFPARTFREALQSLLFAQIALNLESLDNAVSPGRLDQLLWPFYEADLAAGRLDRNGALELLGCFGIKLSEVVPAFSQRVTRFHGGMFNGQVVVVGGVDREGHDATNALSHMAVELMAALRTRQPNWHARLHQGSPPSFVQQVAEALAAGAAAPAVYNDEVLVPLLEARGIDTADARDYATVGCVEPVAAGCSFLSTDAALLNLPLCLELALNQGRRLGETDRIGVSTPDPATFGSIGDVVHAYAWQLRAAVARLLDDLQAVERANARFHPTPLTSALLRGCVERGRDASEGGALYNGSGIQGVGVVEVGDSLAALEEVVFVQRKASLAEVLEACRSDFGDADLLRRRLLRAPKYGCDDARADRWVARVMDLYAGALSGRTNTRGGAYVPGYYSVTAHVAFGERVGALPSGRRAGAPFSSGISPSSGLERSGPTQALASAARLPLQRAYNGVNFNLQLAPWDVGGASGVSTLRALVEGGFALGCMQMQVNVLDPAVLIEARDHPGRYPGLLVRVSGYSAYFDDLSPAVKDELIARWQVAGSRM